MSSRPLDTSQNVETFLVEVLGRPHDPALVQLAQRIASQEIVNRQQLAQNTLETGQYRTKSTASPAARESLRRQIVDDLFGLPRPCSDSLFVLGEGGSKPRTTLLLEKRAVIVIGSPASGKSRLANKIADEFGAYVLDPDHAKCKLPEYQNGSGAALVHEESVALVFGDPRATTTPLLERVIQKGANIVVPRVGANTGKIEQLNGILRSTGYGVSLVLSSVHRKTAVERALSRFERSGRYVPLGYIYDEVGHEPHLTYYRLRTRKRRIWENYAAYDSETEPPELVCSSKRWPRDIITRAGVA